MARPVRQWWVRRFVGYPTSLDRDGEVVRFLLLGGPVACLTAATWGVTTLFAFGVIPLENYCFSWFTWWVGDSIGALIFAPLTLIVAGAPRAAWWRRRFSLAVPLLVGSGVVAATFVWASGLEQQQVEHEFASRAAVLGHALEHRISRYLVEQRPGPPGSAAGADDLGRIVDDALHRLDREDFELILEDLTAPPGARRRFGAAPAPQPGALASVRWRTEFEAAGRTWQLTVRPAGAQLASLQSWRSWTVLAGGLLAVSLLGAMLLLMTGREARIEALVVERTRAQMLANEQLARSHAELEQAYAERQAMEAQLLRSQRLETAGRVAGQVAHDFNNLLAPLFGYPELIKLHLPDGHPAIAYADAMFLAAQQMASINEDLLALGRRGHVEVQPTDINHLVSQAVSRVAERPTTLVVDCQLDPDLLPVRAAPAQLARVLQNLITNAREAMGDTGRLTLRTENVYVDQPAGRETRVPIGEYVRLAVSDTGGGVAPEIRDRIFDPFFTTKQADRRRGSGLGLSVVQSIVDDHGGYVDLESEPGAGTTFFLYIPVARDAVPGAEPHEAMGGNERLLVVDDDDAQREVARTLLESLGYVVAAVGSGTAAVDYLATHEVDLLLLDMVMPGLDGAETYHRILALRPQQRAILVSGYADRERVALAQQLGAGAFVRKPVTRERLAAAVRHELDRVSIAASSSR